jgi:hypothetical protein
MIFCLSEDVAKSDWAAVIRDRRKNAGRGWHHHSRAPRRRSIGAGDDRLPD